MKSIVRVKGSFGGICNLEMTVNGDMKAAADALQSLLRSHLNQEVELKPGFVERQLFDEERTGTYWFMNPKEMVTVIIKEHRFE